MTWLVNGRERYHADRKYRINWSKKAPSNGSQYVKDFIRYNFGNDIWFEEYRVPGTLLKIDFLNATRCFAIEFHGKQHEEYSKFFHRSRAGYRNSIKRDIKKAEFLQNNKYKLIEIYEEDLPLSLSLFISHGIETV